MHDTILGTNQQFEGEKIGAEILRETQLSGDVSKHIVVCDHQGGDKVEL